MSVRIQSIVQIGQPVIAIEVGSDMIGEYTKEPYPNRISAFNDAEVVWQVVEVSHAAHNSINN